ncbi:NAD(P)-dependent oxidoreductase [Pseudorhodobacter sp. E13]|uniref:NAD(P)-dependent oxidoreductase n=1 Tax=Pseudorhodobacter sp. E13 TaxID=2487931 RepID=UPI000F8D40B7|nr:NAD(P)-dependent oxidoreductase [Pseudorhodobacter sp. E13]RUS59974.1 NAD(P)-dependent oxidoreductase [Pseudorhodobacter sp. E13]
MTHYGYIGLGNLGANCAACLLRAGMQVTVFDLNPKLAERLVAMGATLAPSAEALAGAVDHVITCLPSPAVSERVLRNILPQMKPGASWLEMSTLGREEVLRLGAVAAEAGVRMMELPVTGGVHLAAQGKITMLAGGDKDLYDLHLPAMQAMGDRIFHMGPLGSSSIIKVITNMLAFIHLKATSEALMLAKRGGLDLAQAHAAIAASSGNSFVHETEGALILNGSYDIAFNIDLALKDLGFALGFGKEFGVPLDLASMTNQTYIAAKAAYGGEAQSPMIAKLLEDLLGTDLRAEGFPARLE